MYKVLIVQSFSMNIPQHLYFAHNNANFLFFEIRHWENPGIHVYSFPRNCRATRKSTLKDLSGNRALRTPVLGHMRTRNALNITS